MIEEPMTSDPRESAPAEETPAAAVAAPAPLHRVITPVEHNRVRYEPGEMFPAIAASEAELAELVRSGALQFDHILQAQKAAESEITSKNAEIETLRAEVARLQQEAAAKAARR